MTPPSPVAYIPAPVTHSRSDNPLQFSVSWSDPSNDSGLLILIG